MHVYMYIVHTFLHYVQIVHSSLIHITMVLPTLSPPLDKCPHHQVLSPHLHPLDMDSILGRLCHTLLNFLLVQLEPMALYLQGNLDHGGHQNSNNNQDPPINTWLAGYYYIHRLLLHTLPTATTPDTITK